VTRRAFSNDLHTVEIRKTQIQIKMSGFCEARQAPPRCPFHSNLAYCWDSNVSEIKFVWLVVLEDEISDIFIQIYLRFLGV
jgi:hypothetical protein